VVIIYRLTQINSHDELINSKQMGRYLIQLASRLGEPEFRIEMLQCLEAERQEIMNIAKTDQDKRVIHNIQSGSIS
jgi:hypothetical protein